MRYFFILIFISLNIFALDAFIQPKQLKNIINDQNLIIIDVDSYSLYKKSHINKAIHFDMSTLLAIEENPYMLLKPKDEVQNRFQDLGINDDSKVIIYSHNTKKGFLDASYLAFTLIYNGFENVSILDGGYMGWVFQNELLISSEKFSPKDDGNFIFKENKNIFIDLQYLKQQMQNTIILDSRTPQEYFGIEKSKNIAGIGHIPHAKSSFYRYSFLKDETIREDKELNEIYIDGYTLRETDEIIVYGNSIYDASMLWYILYKKMGFKNTKLYGASLLEWGNKPTLPMQRFKWE
jgi:thiosulfate/3-mercaptopyruvate sulfurtransferase